MNLLPEIAATNHPELIDPALWRRFDLVVEFKMPDAPIIKSAIKRFLGVDYSNFERWIDILACSFKGESFSNIERDLYRFRRSLALKLSSEQELVEKLVKSRFLSLDRQGGIEMAVLLSKQTSLSQHAISELTGISRDTIRKHSAKLLNTKVK